ncbi:FkbM family methyltransferase [Pedobacter sp. UBA4863]|uniref:FkbM family methyltransferase n=1 Tax=Pedobacter sp. UBA4863 TaxID=1947060 RepID=UPI0025CCE3C3|nr:FkbM family methyltransferase [Pedobacter sp. UBA4863]
MKKIIFRLIELLFSKEKSSNYFLLPVIRGPLKGIKLYLNLHKNLESAYFLGKYDYHILNNLNKIIKKDWIIWDCGTYLGYYTIYFSKNAKLVYAFEPDDKNRSRTKQNLDINNITNFELHKVAISDKTGFIEFIVNNNSNSHIPGGYIGKNKEEYGKIEKSFGFEKVPSSTLDDLETKLGTPDLIKIDIEGFELYAIDYCHNLATNSKTSFIIESHNPETDKKLFQFYQKYNFNAFNIETMEELVLENQFNGTIFFRKA